MIPPVAGDKCDGCWPGHGVIFLSVESEGYSNEDTVLYVYLLTVIYQSWLRAGQCEL